MKKKIGIILVACFAMFATGCGCDQKKNADEQKQDQTSITKAEIQEDLVTPLESSMENQQVDKISGFISEQSDYYELLNGIVQNTDPTMTSEMYQAYLTTRTQDEYAIEEIDGQYYLSFTGETIDLLSMTSTGGYTDLASFQALLAQQPKNKGGVLIRLIEEDGTWKIDPSDINFGMVLFGGTVVQ